ncbi:MAG: AAA family ATPase [Planctomycetota bacterium]
MEPTTQPQTEPLAPSAATDPTVADAGSLVLIQGRTLRHVLLAARRDHGSRAVVVDQRNDAGGVRVVVSTAVPRSAHALREMRSAAAAILDTTPPVENVAPERGLEQAQRTRTPLADVERRLRERGASRKLRERVLEAVAARESEGAHPLDLAAEEVGRLFSVAQLPQRAGETAILAFVGRSGVGKTATAAKLATRLVRAGRRVAFATLGEDRVGARAELRAHAESLRIPAIELRDPARLAAELARAPGRLDMLLVDGSDDLEADVDALEALRHSCESAGAAARRETLIVLPATASGAALEDATRAASPLAPIGAVVTKLDEAAKPMPVLEHANDAGLGFAFLSNGPQIGPHFFRATPERFADLALVGRLG